MHLESEYINPENPELILAKNMNFGSIIKFIVLISNLGQYLFKIMKYPGVFHKCLKVGNGLSSV